MSNRNLSIVGGRVFTPGTSGDGGVVRDLYVRDGMIVDAPDVDAEIIDATRKAILPGFVNAHHHSYDVLAKGLLEDMPFDIWALHSQPAYMGVRSQEEVRARTLIGGLECLRSGITTIQDMCSLVPFDEETLDTILGAYEELGIRVVFSVAVRDVAQLDIAPYLQDMPNDTLQWIEGRAAPAVEQLAFVEAQLQRLPQGGLRSWALSPSGPQRCTDELLEGMAALSESYDLPVFTHTYETKVQTARARDLYNDHGGSMVRYLDAMGLLNERTNLVHSVWTKGVELEMVATKGATIVHNPVSNMKLHSGIAPISLAQRLGIPIALGCDNCSCGDTQNMFQAMKAMCLLASVADGMPSGVLAADAFRAATVNGANAVHDERLGHLALGARADFALIDLDDLAYLPMNNFDRQLVYAETGRGVATVVVDGKVILRDGMCLTVDESALREEVSELMTAFRHDFSALHLRAQPAVQPLLSALSRVSERDVGVDRLLSMSSRSEF